MCPGAMASAIACTQGGPAGQHLTAFDFSLSIETLEMSSL